MLCAQGWLSAEIYMNINGATVACFIVILYMRALVVFAEGNLCFSIAPNP